MLLAIVLDVLHQESQWFVENEGVISFSSKQEFWGYIKKLVNVWSWGIPNRNYKHIAKLFR